MRDLVKYIEVSCKTVWGSGMLELANLKLNDNLVVFEEIQKIKY